MYIQSSASLRYTLSYLFVQFGCHHIARKVFLERAVPHRDGASLFCSDRKNKYLNTLLSGLLSGFDSPRLIILSIGDENEGTSHIGFLRESGCGTSDGLCHIGSLNGYRGRIQLVKKHLGRNVVAGHRQKRDGTTGKGYQPNLVFIELLNQLADNHL